MKNGKFTKDERDYLNSLEAVFEVRSRQIVYSNSFKKQFIEMYEKGEKPCKIFADAGLPAQLIGYKRIERCCARWKFAASQGNLKRNQAPQVKHNKRIETLKIEKREAVEKQREIRRREVEKLEAKLKKQKQRARTREQKIIDSQKAEIERLKSQVKVLKANGTLARTSRRAPGTTQKSERFELIFQLKSVDESLIIEAACEALEVSKSGYYEYLKAFKKREERILKDEVDEAKIRQAFESHHARKGSRLVVDCLLREQNVKMSRKKVQRHMRAMGISGFVKRKRPYKKIGIDDEPKIAENVVKRNFMTGKPLEVLSTDITYLPCSDAGFVYMSAVIDCETRRLLSYKCSTSMEEKFVIETHNQLKKFKLSPNVIEQSDQGVHYTAKAYREILRTLGVQQSMSRRGCCYDNAPIESFWGRMKEQLGDTKKLTAHTLMQRIDEYVDYYNNCRGQSRLGNLTPVEYERKLLVA